MGGSEVGGDGESAGPSFASSGIGADLKRNTNLRKARSVLAIIDSSIGTYALWFDPLPRSKRAWPEIR